MRCSSGLDAGHHRRPDERRQRRVQGRRASRSSLRAPAAPASASSRRRHVSSSSDQSAPSRPMKITRRPPRDARRESAMRRRPRLELGWRPCADRRPRLDGRSTPRPGTRTRPGECDAPAAELADAQTRAHFNDSHSLKTDSGETDKRQGRQRPAGPTAPRDRAGQVARTSKRTPSRMLRWPVNSASLSCRKSGFVAVARGLLRRPGGRQAVAGRDDAAVAVAEAVRECRRSGRLSCRL